MNTDTLLNLIKSRRSIRKWNDKPVSYKDLDTILEAGLYAPTGANCQKVRVKIVTDTDTIQSISKNTSSWFENEYPTKIIAVLYDLKKTNRFNINCNFPHEHWHRLIWQDTASSITNMLLTAESLGLKTCWVSVKPYSEETIHEILQLPKHYIVTSFIFLGYSNTETNIDTDIHQDSPIKRNMKEFVLN